MLLGFLFGCNIDKKILIESKSKIKGKKIMVSRYFPLTIIYSHFPVVIQAVFLL